MLGNNGENVKAQNGSTLFVPKGFKVCTGCGGNKTKTMGSQCFSCHGHGYVRK